LVLTVDLGTWSEIFVVIFKNLFQKNSLANSNFWTEDKVEEVAKEEVLNAHSLLELGHQLRLEVPNKTPPVCPEAPSVFAILLWLIGEGLFFKSAGE
jgi:hypothetical protein